MCLGSVFCNFLESPCKLLYHMHADGAEVLRGKSPVEERLAEVQRLLGELDTQSHHHGNSVLRLSDEVEMMSPVFYAVLLVSPQQPLDNIRVLNETWAGGVASKDIAFFVQSEEEDMRTEGTLKVEGHKNGIHQLTSSNLPEVQVLNYLCQNKLNSSKWFFIGNGDLYVKTHSLETYLMEVDALHYHYGYLGKPIKRDPIGRVCMPGPGSVLSHMTMQEVCLKISECASLKPVTDCVLGECTRRLVPWLQCNKEGNPHSLFLKFDGAKRGPITEQKHRDILDVALTVYPVSDPKLMYAVHQLMVGERLNASYYHLQQIKASLDLMDDLLPQADIHTHQVKQEASITREDIVTWKLVSNNLLMSEEERAPSVKIPSVWKHEFNSLIDKCKDYLSTWEEGSYTFKRIVNAYFRVVPATGVDYIIDFEGKEGKTEDEFSLAAKHFRVSLSRRLNSLEVNPALMKAAGVELKHVTVAVVMTTEYIEQFQGFMSRLEKLLDYDQKIDLLLVNMKSKKRGKEKSSSVRSTLSHYETKYPQTTFTVLDSPTIVSREHGVSLVIRELRPSDIVFLADLDIEFDIGFLERCRSLPLQGQQAYFPIPFSEANPSLLREINHEKMEDAISEHSGHWLTESKSVACLYAADVLVAAQQARGKGIPNSIAMGDVYQTLVGKGYEVIRATDKGLRLKYDGGRECKGRLVGEGEDECSDGDYVDLYSRTQLSALFFDHEGGDKF